MVTGIPPFYESDQSALKNTILHGTYKGSYPEFDKTTSIELRDLISKMICLKPQDRITSDGIIESKWIQSALQRHSQIPRKLVEDAFLNMKSFKIGYQL